MKKKPLLQRPPYPIESVDNALRLLQLLRDGGGIRLTDAARDLQIAPSTAHRLMAMLVYRGFALQDDRRQYVAGPALGARAIGAPWLRELRRIAAEPLEILSSRLNETVNLMVRVGVNVRFLFSVEASAVLRIGDRGGTVLPALEASGGKALLAYESEARLGALYRGRSAELSGYALDDDRYERLLGELEVVRANGYALNREETESGVGALGVTVHGPRNLPLAAISVSTPINRLDNLLSPHSLTQILDCRDEVSEAAKEIDLEAG